MRAAFNAPDALSSYLRMCWDSGDPWGSCMGTFFDVAAEMYHRGLDMPDEWKYRPGASSDPREPASAAYDECASATDAELRAWGDALHECSEELRRMGRDY